MACDTQSVEGSVIFELFSVIFEFYTTLNQVNWSNKQVYCTICGCWECNKNSAVRHCKEAHPEVIAKLLEQHQEIHKPSYHCGRHHIDYIILILVISLWSDSIQISKIVGCDLTKQGDLTSEFIKGACNTFQVLTDERSGINMINTIC